MKQLTAILFILLLSCNTKSNNEVNADAEESKDTIEKFETFYPKFLQDSAFQVERTADTIIKDRQQFSRIQSIYETMHGKAFGNLYLLDTFFVGYTLKAEPKLVVETFFDEAGYGRSERHFQRINYTWQLIRYDSVNWFRRQ